jgi:hypothetical protein
LKSHPAYIGAVGNTKFIWEEMKRVPRRAEDDKEVEENGLKVDLEMKIIMEKRTKQTSAVVLNYDTLQKFMGIDYERQVISEDQNEDLPF